MTIVLVLWQANSSFMSFVVFGQQQKVLMELFWVLMVALALTPLLGLSFLLHFAALAFDSSAFHNEIYMLM